MKENFPSSSIEFPEPDKNKKIIIKNPENSQFRRFEIPHEHIENLKEISKREQLETKEDIWAEEIDVLETKSRSFFQQALEPAILGEFIKTQRNYLNNILDGGRWQDNKNWQKLKVEDFQRLEEYQNFEAFRKNFELFESKTFWYQLGRRAKIKKIKKNLNEFEKYFKSFEHYIKKQEIQERNKYVLGQEAWNLVEKIKKSGVDNKFGEECLEEITKIASNLYNSESKGREKLENLKNKHFQI